MKKYLLLFFTALICYSCEIQYDGETRIVVQGQLIDRNNNPISNKKIEINTNSESTFGGYDLISFTDTDAEGKFTLVFPAPKSDSISIITSINANQKNEIQNKIIKGLKKNFSNYKLDLNKIVLYKQNEITQLKVLLNKTSNNKQIQDLQIEGLQANYFIDLNAAKEKNDWFETEFDVVKNQNLNINYSIIEYSDPAKAVITNHQAVITINSEKVIHTITY